MRGLCAACLHVARTMHADTCGRSTGPNLGPAGLSTATATPMMRSARHPVARKHLPDEEEMALSVA